MKEVQVYQVGRTPRLDFQAQIEKTGVIKVVSQTGGVVQTVRAKEGQVLKKGASVLNLSSTYDGGNPASLQAAITSKQHELTQRTYDLQKDLINKQREMAAKNSENTQALRDIQAKSLDETKGLIGLNQQILDSLDKDIQALEATNINDVNRAAITQLKELKSQFQGGQNQLKASLRGLEYQTDAGKPAGQLGDLQKEVTLKQLELQEKNLNLGLEIAGLQVRLAALNVSLFHPTAPLSGTVERIFVKPGQMINPGTPLFLMTSKDKSITVVVRTPEAIAKKVSKVEPSTLYLGDQVLEVAPNFVSGEATDGQLYSIIFSLSAREMDAPSDDSFVKVSLAMEADNDQSQSYLPLDVVFQTQEETIVHLIKEGKVVSKKVELGDVFGSFVEIRSGLEKGSQVILSRNVVEGDDVHAAGE